MEEPTAARAAIIGPILESLSGWVRVLSAPPALPFEGVSLTRSQLDALFMLAHDSRPVTPSLLADSLGLTAGAVTQLLEPLKSAGLVDAKVHPTDARSRVLTLTASARDTLAVFEARIVRELQPRFAVLTTAELHTLRDLLGKAIPR